MSNLPLHLFPTNISTTQDIEVFNRCPYLWFNNRVVRWRKESYNIHLLFGAEFAKARELTLIAYHQECLTAEDSIAIGQKYIAEHFTSMFEPSGFNNDVKTPAKMQEVFARYCEQEFPLDSDFTPFVLPDGSISVDCMFTFELPMLHPQTNLPLTISAKPDLLGFDSNDVINLVDDKTASQSGMNDVVKTTNILRAQNQFVQYVSLINKHKVLGEGRRIEQVRVRKIVVTKKALVDGKKGTIPVNSQVVEQYSFAIDRWYQQEWLATTMDLLYEMVEMYKNWELGMPSSRAFRRRYGNCERFFMPCQLVEHCTDGAKQDLSSLGYTQEFMDKDTGEQKPLQQKLEEMGLLQTTKKEVKDGI